LTLGLALKAANEFVPAEVQLSLIERDGVDRFARRWALNHLGDISLIQGRTAEAIQRYAECESLATADGDSELLAETAADLAELHMRRSEQLAGVDPGASLEHGGKYVHYLELELRLAQGLASRPARARAYRNAAKRERALGNVQEAINLYERSLTFVDPGVDSHQFLIPYAKALRLVDRYRDALSIVRRVLDWGRQIGARRSEAIAHQYLGLLLMEQSLAAGESDLGAARIELQRAVAMHQQIGFEQGRRETEIDLAELSAHQGDHDETARHLDAVGAERSVMEGESHEQNARAVVAQLRANGEVNRAERVARALGRVGIPC
jgi:tetratricopeptide (TPR) repeat protein